MHTFHILHSLIIFAPYILYVKIVHVILIKTITIFRNKIVEKFLWCPFHRLLRFNIFYVKFACIILIYSKLFLILKEKKIHLLHSSHKLECFNIIFGKFAWIIQTYSDFLRKKNFIHHIYFRSYNGLTYFYFNFA